MNSLRAENLPEKVDEFSTVRATLPGALSLPTKVYGLSQIEPSPEIVPDVAQTLAGWLEQGLAFSRLLLLRQTLEGAGTAYDELEWRAVELGVDQRWGESGVQPGDMLRVGNRWVLVLRDRLGEGVLDRQDLCLDFDQGSRIREIGEVFTGEGLVDWAPVGDRGPGRDS